MSFRKPSEAVLNFCQEANFGTTLEITQRYIEVTNLLCDVLSKVGKWTEVPEEWWDDFDKHEEFVEEFLR